MSEASLSEHQGPGRSDKLKNPSLLIPLLVCLVLTCLSAAWHHGGVLHYEVEVRLPYYLSHGPLLNKLYDSNYLDDSMYQARELSYLFDFLDAKFIAFCVEQGHPHFLSIVQYVFLILISLVFWQFGARDLKLPWWLVLGIILLYWTSPAVFLSGVFFRTAKIGVALLAVLFYWLIYRHLRDAQDGAAYRFSRWNWLKFFLLAWAATLFDRQGVFMVGLVIVFLAFWYLGYWQKSALDLAQPFVAALAMSFLYNYEIAPWLTLATNGYWPDFRYQHLPWPNLFSNPAYYAGGGLTIYLDTVRFLCGSIPAWAAVALVVILSVLAFRGGRSTKGFFPAASGLLLTQTVFLWALAVLMFLRHAALVWPDVRRSGYMLPAVSMFGMTLLFLLSRLQFKNAVNKYLVPALLCAALGGNIVALPRHRAILLAGSLAEAYQTTPRVLEALRRLPDPQYPVPPEVGHDPVYRFFRNGFFARRPMILKKLKNGPPTPKQQ